MKRVALIVGGLTLATLSFLGAWRLIELRGGTETGGKVSELVFVSEALAEVGLDFYRFEIRKQSADGQDQLITPIVADGVPHVTASPDGSRIAYGTVYEGKPSLVVANADGSGARAVAEGWLNATWSPDGDEILFSPVDSGGIFKVSAEGGDATRILGHGGQPSWSPDGRSIAFIERGDVFIMSADGSGIRALTTDGFEPHDMEPQWSPDGSAILFRSERDGTCSLCAETESPFDLYTADPATGAIRRLTDNTQHEQHAVWSPDGSLIAYDDGEIIYTLDPERPNSPTVVRRDAFLPVWLP